MLGYLLAIIALALACGVWVAVQRGLRTLDPPLDTSDSGDRCGGCGGCANRQMPD